MAPSAGVDRPLAPEPAMVLDFWFRVAGPARWFASDPDFDQVVATLFAALLDRLGRGVPERWRDSPGALLAAVIALDQFPRNIARGTAAAFAFDAQARTLTRTALAAGWDTALSPPERQFLYMPLMHSEDAADQADSVALFDALGLPGPADYARRHRDVITRFGRFPHRNAALGRTSMAEEMAYLEEPGSGF